MSDYLQGQQFAVTEGSLVDLKRCNILKCAPNSALWLLRFSNFNTTNVLEAGVPIVTLQLENMATRVVGSLCYAIGFGELVMLLQEGHPQPLNVVENDTNFPYDQYGLEDIFTGLLPSETLSHHKILVLMEATMMIGICHRHTRIPLL
eukprot:Gb_23266 [translate_table: standard]